MGLSFDAETGQWCSFRPGPDAAEQNVRMASDWSVLNPTQRIRMFSTRLVRASSGCFGRTFAYRYGRSVFRRGMLICQYYEAASGTFGLGLDALAGAHARGTLPRT